MARVLTIERSQIILENIRFRKHVDNVCVRLLIVLKNKSKSSELTSMTKGVLTQILQLFKTDDCLI